MVIDCRLKHRFTISDAKLMTMNDVFLSPVSGLRQATYFFRRRESSNDEFILFNTFCPSAYRL